MLSSSGLWRVAEVGREAIGVNRRHPFQIRDHRLGVLLGQMHVGHFTAPGWVAVRVHQKLHHRLLGGLAAGHRHPLLLPCRVEPRLGQVGREVGAVAEKGVAVDAGPGLNDQLAPRGDRPRLLRVVALAEQQLLAADHRHVVVLGRVVLVRDLMIDHRVGRYMRTA